MKKVLYLLSDSVGETVLRISRAATTQFVDGGDLELSQHFNLNDTARIDSIVEEAKQHSCCFMYTIVEQDLRAHLQMRLEEAGLPSHDIMTPMLKLVGDLLGSEPLHRPGLTHMLDETYFRRIEAIEFAVRYDDGKYPSGFLEADIVLLGVSRTSKTPLSMFLANRGIKVANLPLMPGVPLPEELLKISPKKIIGLTIASGQLLQVRQERLVDLNLPSSAPYAQPDQIERELENAMALFADLGCHVIDVSNKAIEETASRIIMHLNRMAREKMQAQG